MNQLEFSFNNKIAYFQFSNLKHSEKMVHGSFRKYGGVSKPPFATLNLGESVGDDPNDVAENSKRLTATFGIQSIGKMNQVHGKKVLHIEAEGSYECDGLVTKTKNLLLLIRHADCQPALFYDPKQEVIGAVHAGWKGLTLNIYQETVRVMKQTFGSDPQDLLVGIGPSLGPCHAEFINYQDEFPEELHQFKKEECYFDLWEIALWQLREAGILEKNIEIARICTFDAKEDCYSYRREKLTGRHGTVIALKAS